MPYTKTTNFAIKDTYLTGNPAKIVKGVEIDAEFDAIATNFNGIGPLGTAAAATLTTTATDSTAGRVLKVGDFGLGHTASPLQTSWDALTVTGFYSASPSTPGTPPVAGMYYTVRNQTLDATGVMLQEAFRTDSARFYFRRRNASGTFGGWVEVATSVNSLARGQAWQTVTGSRALGVTYTNTSGKPIAIIIEGLTSGQAMKMYCDVEGMGVTIATAPATSPFVTSSVLVPPDVTYLVTANVGGISIVRWVELR